MSDQHHHILQSRGRRRKQELRKLLLNRNLDQLESWARDNNNALGTLSSMLFESDPMIRWRAIEAIGRTSGFIARNDPEKVRGFLRRLFWLMNDESGGICWHAPEAIAETLAAVPSVLDEFGELFLSFLVEEPFEAGICWGIARLTETDRIDRLRDSVAAKADFFSRHMKSDSAHLRACAVLAAAGLRLSVTPELKANLERDTAETELYDFSAGILTHITVGKLAQSLLPR